MGFIIRWGIYMLQQTLYGQSNVERSIDILRAMEPDYGYMGKFSGGKDSAAIALLLKLSGVKHTLTYNHTTVDPPELVYHIRRKYPECRIEYPTETMWHLIARKKMPPTRVARYCCDVLKERKADPGTFIVTGIRWAESNNRKHRSMFEKFRGRNAFGTNDLNIAVEHADGCLQSGKTHILNPIISWSDEEVFGFLKHENIELCCLYNEGFTRLGCIGCPMTSVKKREREFERWPKYKNAYIRAFTKMLKNIVSEEKTTKWFNGQDVFNWWMSQ